MLLHRIIVFGPFLTLLTWWADENAVYGYAPRIFNWSFTAGIVICAVLLLRLFLRKAPKIFSYALWGIVLLRLLCPVSLSSELSLLNALDVPEPVSGAVEYIPHDIVHSQQPQVDIPLPGVSQAINSALPQGQEQLRIDPLEAPASFAFLVWTVGVRAMGIYGIVSYILLRRRLVGAARLRENIFIADRIDTPFVAGLFRPRIYLPSGLGENETDHIILHERHHIRRGDHIFKLLGFVALALHWFNPLVWLAFVLSSKDMELSCDEAVTGDMDADKRADYSRTLLALATGRRIIAGTPLAFGEGKVTGRIKAVLNHKKPTVWVVAAALVVVIIAAVSLLTNPTERVRLSIEPGVYEYGDCVYSQYGADYGLADHRICIAHNSVFFKNEGKWVYDMPLREYPLSDREFQSYLPNEEGWLRIDGIGSISHCLQYAAKDASFILLIQTADGKSYCATGWEDLGERGQEGSDDTYIAAIWEMKLTDEEVDAVLPDKVANPLSSHRMNAWMRLKAYWPEEESTEFFERFADNYRLMYSGDGQTRLLTVPISSAEDLDYLEKILAAEGIDLNQNLRNCPSVQTLLNTAREELEDRAVLLCLVPSWEAYTYYSIFEPYAEDGTLVVQVARDGEIPVDHGQVILITVDRNDFEACHSYDVVLLPAVEKRADPSPASGSDISS